MAGLGNRRPARWKSQTFSSSDSTRQALEIGLAVATLGGQVVVAYPEEGAITQAIRDGEILARLAECADLSAFEVKRKPVLEEIRPPAQQGTPARRATARGNGRDTLPSTSDARGRRRSGVSTAPHPPPQAAARPRRLRKCAPCWNGAAFQGGLCCVLIRRRAQTSRACCPSRQPGHAGERVGR